MTARPIPRRYWRRHGTGPLPSGAEALVEPFNAFPSWFLRITCERCGQERMVNQVRSPARVSPASGWPGVTIADFAAGGAGSVGLSSLAGGGAAGSGWSSTGGVGWFPADRVATMAGTLSATASGTDASAGARSGRSRACRASPQNIGYGAQRKSRPAPNSKAASSRLGRSGYRRQHYGSRRRPLGRPPLSERPNRDLSRISGVSS